MRVATMTKLHIHAPAGVYVGQRRKRGMRLWESVTTDLKTKEEALIVLASKMKGYARGRVIFCAEYYDPNVVAEIKQ